MLTSEGKLQKTLTFAGSSRRIVSKGVSTKSKLTSFEFGSSVGLIKCMCLGHKRCQVGWYQPVDTPACLSVPASQSVSQSAIYRMFAHSWHDGK